MLKCMVANPTVYAFELKWILKTENFNALKTLQIDRSWLIFWLHVHTDTFCPPAVTFNKKFNYEKDTFVFLYRQRKVN